MAITFEPIGIIHTPFQEKEGMPIQSSGAEGVQAHVIINKEYVDGLVDLNGFSHIILIYYFHKAHGFNLRTKPFLDEKKRGVFATRAPKRPNGIGVSVVKLLTIEDNILHVENVDILNGTPLLDIKPYIPAFDVFNVHQTGWINDKISRLDEIQSDDRFE